MIDSFFRRVSFLILRTVLKITPTDSEAWGRAMLAELEHVEGSLAALAWALGCMCTLTKEAVKEAVLRKPMLGTSAVCIVAVLMLLPTPTFRQALTASFSPWKMISQTPDPDAPYTNTWPDTDLKQLAILAEKERDANTMAFIAVRLKDETASARLAESAVETDPSLTWVYYVVAVRHSGLTDQVKKWANELHKWDKENAAPYLLTAESIDIEQVRQGKTRPGFQQQDAEWHTAMAAAVAAPRFDDYLPRQLEFDREVVRHRQLFDPLVFLEGFPDLRVPSFAMSDVSRYVDPSSPFRFLLEPGSDGESDRAVVRYLREQLRSRRSRPTWMAPPSTSIRTIQLCGLLMVCFGTVLLAAVGYGRRRSMLALIGCGGLFVSSLTLYLVYRPFAESFRDFIVSGSGSRLDELRVFYGLTMPPLFLSRYSAPLLRSYVWSAVFLLCLAVLFLLVSRQVRKRFRFTAYQSQRNNEGE